MRCCHRNRSRQDFTHASEGTSSSGAGDAARPDKSNADRSSAAFSVSAAFTSRLIAIICNQSSYRGSGGHFGINISNNHRNRHFKRQTISKEMVILCAAVTLGFSGGRHYGPQTQSGAFIQANHNDSDADTLPSRASGIRSIITPDLVSQRRSRKPRAEPAHPSIQPAHPPHS